jgi:hypothetical protein
VVLDLDQPISPPSNAWPGVQPPNKLSCVNKVLPYCPALGECHLRSSDTLAPEHEIVPSWIGCQFRDPRGVDLCLDKKWRTMCVWAGGYSAAGCHQVMGNDCELQHLTYLTMALSQTECAALVA